MFTWSAVWEGENTCDVVVEEGIDDVVGSGGRESGDVGDGGRVSGDGSKERASGDVGDGGRVNDDNGEGSGEGREIDGVACPVGDYDCGICCVT